MSEEKVEKAEKSFRKVLEREDTKPDRLEFLQPGN